MIWNDDIYLNINFEDTWCLCETTRDTLLMHKQTQQTCSIVLQDANTNNVQSKQILSAKILVILSIHDFTTRHDFAKQHQIPFQDPAKAKMKTNNWLHWTFSSCVDPNIKSMNWHSFTANY